MEVVRVKLYRPNSDNHGTRWQEVTVTDDGRGIVTFTAYKPTHWSKMRIATRNNDRVLQDHLINPDPDHPLDPMSAYGVRLDPGETVTIAFVIAEMALQVRINDDYDDEDRATINLLRIRRRLAEFGRSG